MNNPLSPQTTILVIDDDLHIVQLMKAALEEAGFHVVSGYDGQMALHLAKAHTPKLIVMDFNMPLTNGLRALEFIRKTPQIAMTPVIFLTGAKSEIFDSALQRTPRVTYVKKPVDLVELVSLVRQIVARLDGTTA